MDVQLDTLKYDAAGLVTAVIQDDANGEVLAVFFMNRDALAKTISTGKVHTYSRSRKRLALKGESSGHFQHVRSVRLDCDKDAVLIKVEQVAGACHEGYRSCFYRELQSDGDWKTVETKVFDPDAVYHK